MTATTDLHIQEVHPAEWFAAKGSGNSNDGHEGGSLPQAIRSAGIGNINVYNVGYAMPVNAAEIMLPEMQQGSIIPGITSIAHGVQGETVTAAIAFAKVIETDTNTISNILLCKNTYHEYEHYARKHIMRQLHREFDLQYDFNNYHMIQPRLLIQEAQISQKFGTAYTAICFKSSAYPVSGM